MQLSNVLYGGYLEQASGNTITEQGQVVGDFCYFTKYQFTYDPDFPNDQNPTSLIPFVLTDFPKWESQLPDLTTEDLEDTPEQMLARRAQGIQSAQSTILRRHIYPVDPLSAKTAKEFTDKLVVAAEANKQTAIANYQTALIEKQQKVEQEKQERKEYEAYKKTKQDSQTGIKSS